MTTLIIIPTYLEAENIADILGQVRTSAPEADILVVDDSSPDGTADLVKQTAEELGQIEALVQPRPAMVWATTPGIIRMPGVPCS